MCRPVTQNWDLLEWNCLLDLICRDCSGCLVPVSFSCMLVTVLYVCSPKHRLHKVLYKLLVWSVMQPELVLDLEKLEKVKWQEEALLRKFHSYRQRKLIALKVSILTLVWIIIVFQWPFGSQTLSAHERKARGRYLSWEWSGIWIYLSTQIRELWNEERKNIREMKWTEREGDRSPPPAEWGNVWSPYAPPPACLLVDGCIQQEVCLLCFHLKTDGTLWVSVVNRVNRVEATRRHDFIICGRKPVRISCLRPFC